MPAHFDFTASCHSQMTVGLHNTADTVGNAATNEMSDASQKGDGHRDDIEHKAPAQAEPLCEQVVQLMGWGVLVPRHHRIKSAAVL